MLQKLDDEIISFCPAVEIAALSEKEQRELLVAMEYAQAIPSLSQAQRIRQLSKEKQLSLEKMEEIMCEVKKGEITRVQIFGQHSFLRSENLTDSMIR